VGEVVKCESVLGVWRQAVGHCKAVISQSDLATTVYSTRSERKGYPYRPSSLSTAY
jgi:hypothetical protein